MGWVEDLAGLSCSLSRSLTYPWPFWPPVYPEPTAERYNFIHCTSPPCQTGGPAGDCVMAGERDKKSLCRQGGFRVCLHVSLTAILSRFGVAFLFRSCCSTYGATRDLATAETISALTLLAGFAADDAVAVHFWEGDGLESVGRGGSHTRRVMW